MRLDTLLNASMTCLAGCPRGTLGEGRRLLRPILCPMCGSALACLASGHEGSEAPSPGAAHNATVSGNNALPSQPKTHLSPKELPHMGPYPP